MGETYDTRLVRSPERGVFRREGTEEGGGGWCGGGGVSWGQDCKGKRGDRRGYLNSFVGAGGEIWGRFQGGRSGGLSKKGVHSLHR